MAAYAAGHYYSPTLSSCDEVPRWVFLLSAWSLLFYQVMANAVLRAVASELGELGELDECG